MNENKGRQGFEYFAFISYKREDEKWAKWLQRKLEYYKIPISIRKNHPDLPERIRPVFKDTTDLSPGVLSQKIQEALSGSRFLIVICSPRSAASEWVSKEVQAFIDSGRQDNIIPFIIGGTPNASSQEDECFPEGLRKLSGEKEMLGANINEMGRDAAAIKVIARMFNLRFDTLWQRYERERKRRMALIIAFALLALLSTLAITFLYADRNRAYSSLEETNRSLDKANRDLASSRDSILFSQEQLALKNDSLQQSFAELDLANIRLDLSNRELQESNNNLKIEKDRVLEALRNVKYEQLQLLANNTRQSLEAGNVYKAVKDILKILPEADNEIPFVPNAMDILLQGMSLLGEEGYKMIANLPADTVFSPDGRWTAYNDEGTYYLFDIHEQKPFKLSGEDNVDYNAISFSKDGKSLFGIGCNFCYEWDLASRVLKKSWNVAEAVDNWDGTPESEQLLWPEEVRVIPKFTSCHYSDDKNWGSFQIFKMEAEEGGKYFLISQNGKLIDRVNLENDWMLNAQYNYAPSYPYLAVRASGGDVIVTDLLKKTRQELFLPYANPRQEDRLMLLNTGSEIVFNSKLYSYREVPHLYALPICRFIDQDAMLREIEKLSHSNQKTHPEKIVHDNFIWTLVDRSYGCSLYSLESNDPDDIYSQLSVKLLFEEPNGKRHIFTPTVYYTMGNGLDLLHGAKILNKHEVLLIASQGLHSVYDVYTENRRFFSASNLNTYSSGFCHAQMFLEDAFVVDNGSTLIAISGGGVLSIYDIATGFLIMETMIDSPAECKNPLDFTYMDKSFKPFYITKDGRYLYGAVNVKDNEFYAKYLIPTPAEYIEFARKHVRDFWIAPLPDAKVMKGLRVPPVYYRDLPVVK